MPFRYLRDPLFLVSLGLYIANRLCFESWMPRSFFSNYLNDLICMPFCVPIMLFVMRKLRLRNNNAPPQSYEIILPLILWSIMFELWLPTVSLFRGLATADHRDILCYVAGALVAGIWWKKYYRNCPAPSTASNQNHPRDTRSVLRGDRP